MVPMSLALESGSKMEAPLGMAVIGGLVLSTFATLLILPAIYSIIMTFRLKGRPPFVYVSDLKFVQPSIDPDDPESLYFDGGEESYPGKETVKDGQAPKNGQREGDDSGKLTRGQGQPSDHIQQQNTP
jgi:hypothetical protein